MGVFFALSSFLFFALLISAQEGATVLFILVTVCVGVGKDDADRMPSYEKKAAFLMAFLDRLWVFLVNPTLWQSLPCRPVPACGCAELRAPGSAPAAQGVISTSQLQAEMFCLSFPYFLHFLLGYVTIDQVDQKSVV